MNTIPMTITKLANGNTIEYKEVDGTFYHAQTDDMIVAILENIRKNDIRVRFQWGDVKIGKDWGDTFGNVGTIGRSTGKIKIPLLIYNKRSLGGGALLDDCIVKISYANKKEGGVLYQHPNYHI